MFLFKRYSIVSLLLFCVIQFYGVKSVSPPVVMWHGMGDSCCFSYSLGGIQKLIEEKLPGIYVHSIRIGNNEVEDVEHSYFGNVNKQVENVCKQLANDPKLKNGYNAIGFSQGAQFMRAVIQRCPHAPILNYISVGGQHQGVYGLPHCGIVKGNMCDYITRLIKYGAYLKFIQEELVQASYWHDPYQENEYRQKNNFLADINNENHINQTYKDNIKKLKSMVLVKFEKDAMVWPHETEWFGFYKPGQAKDILTLAETDLYRQDRLGLRTLNETGRLHFLSLPTNHMQFTGKWFVDNIVNKYLA